MAQKPLMPKATAVWLIDNTALTFEQIADFCGLHKLEVQAIADGEISGGIIGVDPIAGQELTQDEITTCEKSPNRALTLFKSSLPQPETRTKGPRYTPVAKRADKPNGIAWLLKQHPELGMSQISRLIGTTKPTIEAIRDKTHSSTSTMSPQDPVLLGLCKREDMEKAIHRALKKQGKEVEKSSPTTMVVGPAEITVAPVKENKKVAKIAMTPEEEAEALFSKA